ncbi:DUF1427 family protein [Streptomyces sp. ISL-96]|uniref:DUF1427 family protein n=1 Tax=Streptomyces sp. ISL-96 TaxID=2819191 RepID=UPI001BEBA914|nr:DUF1427 family protein [Streptomyces sp. ISL-96]MBT2489442.1 DUF1427 family protein [Streptomyces sp. ISL-96]
MTAGRRTRAAAFARAAGISFTVGLVMGSVYWCLDVPAPAPTLLGLTGLLGIGLGERAATATRTRLRRHRMQPGRRPRAVEHQPS